MKKHTALLLAALLLAQTFCTSAAYAQAPAQVYTIHDEATFKELTKEVRFMPPGKPELEFSIQAPKDWKMEAAREGGGTDLGQRLLGDLLVFESPILGVHRMYLRVQVVGVDHEIDARSWLQNYLLTNGYARDEEIPPSTSPYKASSYYTFVQDGQSTYAYIQVQFNGGTALLIRFEMPLKMKEYAAYIQKQAVDSFRFSFEQKVPVEKSTSFTVADAAKFNYPQSWQVAGSDFKNLDSLMLHLVNKSKQDTVQGYVGIMAMRRSSSLNFIGATQQLRSYFMDTMNLSFEKLELSEPYPSAADRFIFKRHEIYTVQSRKEGQAPQELRLVALGDQNWYVFVFLVTLKQEDFHYTWARNVRSFEVMLASLI